ncbi:hypothetical protein A0J61_10408 [Choanephora cucurbitarum]|uniref:Uncharacterized protein n=1 Tax=Choanephora cucurbitarum TaxID=101091 RepID=A0A1C7MXJ1_9FUNG|nr:hypothetical protein A0J61_10408 [Choanephora cucurbitarum]
MSRPQTGATIAFVGFIAAFDLRLGQFTSIFADLGYHLSCITYCYSLQHIISDYFLSLATITVKQPIETFYSQAEERKQSKVKQTDKAVDIEKQRIFYFKFSASTDKKPKRKKPCMTWQVKVEIKHWIREKVKEGNIG